MIVKVYLSNIAPGWPIQRQKELLAKHVPGWPDVATYVDQLSPAKRKAHVPASLVRRGELFRETERPAKAEVIMVASLGCFAWEQMDFLQCVANASKRGATIIALDTGRRIAPDASPAEVTEAVKEFIARHRSKSNGGPAGYLVSAAKREADAEAAARSIEDRWQLPTRDYPTNPLLAEAGICRNTANKYIKPRPEAQRIYRNGLAQAHRNQKRRKPEVQEQVA